MKHGRIKIKKTDTKQMELAERIVRDVVKKCVENPKAVKVAEIDKAKRYYNSDNGVNLPENDSFVEWISTIIEINQRGGMWTNNNVRETAKSTIIKNVYKNVFGKDVEILTESPHQYSVDDYYPQKPVDCQDEEADPEMPEENNEQEIIPEEPSRKMKYKV